MNDLYRDHMRVYITIEMEYGFSPQNHNRVYRKV